MPYLCIPSELLHGGGGDFDGRVRARPSRHQVDAVVQRSARSQNDNKHSVTAAAAAAHEVREGSKMIYRGHGKREP